MPLFRISNTICHFSSGVLWTLGFLDTLASWRWPQAHPNFGVQFYRGTLVDYMVVC